MSYDWYLNDVPVDVEQNPRYRTGWYERKGYLFIEPVTFGEAGNYTCVARSPVGQIQTSAQLFVTGSVSYKYGFFRDGSSILQVVVRMCDSFDG